MRESIAGLGTDDETLISTIVLRSEIDLMDIMIDYERMFGVTLQDDVRGDTSGDYENILLKIINPPELAEELNAFPVTLDDIGQMTPEIEISENNDKNEMTLESDTGVGTESVARIVETDLQVALDTCTRPVEVESDYDMDAARESKIEDVIETEDKTEASEATTTSEQEKSIPGLMISKSNEDNASDVDNDNELVIFLQCAEVEPVPVKKQIELDMKVEEETVHNKFKSLDESGEDNDADEATGG